MKYSKRKVNRTCCVAWCARTNLIGQWAFLLCVKNLQLNCHWPNMMCFMIACL